MEQAEAVVAALEAPGTFADSSQSQTMQQLATLAAGPGADLIEATQNHVRPYMVVLGHGFWSFVLFLLNLIVVVGVGAATFWMKGVSGKSAKSLKPESLASEHKARQKLLRSLWYATISAAQYCAQASGANGESRRTRVRAALAWTMHLAAARASSSSHLAQWKYIKGTNTHGMRALLDALRASEPQPPLVRRSYTDDEGSFRQPSLRESSSFSPQLAAHHGAVEMV